MSNWWTSWNSRTHYHSNYVKIQAQSGIAKSIADNEMQQGTPAFGYGDYYKSYVHFKNLPQLAKDIEELKKNKE